MAYEAYGIRGDVLEPMKVLVYDQATGALLKRQEFTGAGEYSFNLGKSVQEVIVIGIPTDSSKNGKLYHSVETVNNLTYDNDIWYNDVDSGRPSRQDWSAQYIYGDELYIAGGYSATTAFNKYNFLTKTWTSLPTLPFSATYCSGAGIGDNFYVAYDNVLRRYNITEETWYTSSTGPYYFRRSSAVYHEGYIYVIGSYYSTYSTYHARYDISQDTWETLTDTPDAWIFRGCAAWDGYIYTVGGGTTTPNAAMYRYNITTNSWDTLDAPTFGASFRSRIEAYNGKLYHFGGVDSSGTSKELWEYDITTATWTQLSDGIQELTLLTGSTGLIYDGRMVCTGGTFYGVDMYKI